MIKRIMIFDMDGVLVDSTHRYQTITDINGVVRIDLEYWRANEHKAYEDKLLPLAKVYQDALDDAEVYVIVATARMLGDADDCFIRDFLGVPDHIIYRKAQDDRSGALLKVLGLNKLFALKGMAAALKRASIEVYEDNHAYLKAMVDNLHAKGADVRGHYVPSNQGH